MSAGYLLDTNVICEIAKGSRANPSAVAWLARTDNRRMYISVITLGEISKGIGLAEDAGRDMHVQRIFLEHFLPERFGERILSFDTKAALCWGLILKRLKDDREAERKLAVDAQIAATAEAANLLVCTRNVRDFVRLKISRTVNPFDGELSD